jgi:PAS domain S-box-containing protein
LALLAQVFDDAPIILTIVDQDLRLRAGNRTWCDATGMSEDERVGGYVPDWYPTLGAHWEDVRRVMATGEALHDAELTTVHPGRQSETRVWRFSAFPLRDATDATVAFGLAAVDVTEERRAQAERDLAWRRLHLLSRASGLLGGSLDLSVTLREMVALVVPEFADACVLLLADDRYPPGAEPEPLILRRVAWAHPPGLPRPFPSMDRHSAATPIDVTGTPLARVFVTRRPLVVDLADPRAADGLRYLVGLARRLRVRHGLLMPLLNGVDCLGCAIFGVAASGRYGEQDIETAMELGGRIAAAVANARAYEDQRTAALILQRALMPRDLPALTDLDVVWRYHPGVGGTEVGGDWLDVIPLSAGRVALVIGDVMGHGLNAAAAMGHLRTATRTLALVDLAPADVLTKLDAVTRGVGTLASMVYAIFDSATHTLTVANAGHLPPALRQPDGTVELLDDTDDIMLGVTEGTFTEARHPFPAGATLALYTDGVVEAPTVSVSEGSRRLLRVLAETSDLPAAADRVLAFVDRADAHDDATVLLARVRHERRVDAFREPDGRGRVPKVVGM